MKLWISYNNKGGLDTGIKFLFSVKNIITDANSERVCSSDIIMIKYHQLFKLYVSELYQFWTSYNNKRGLDTELHKQHAVRNIITDANSQRVPIVYNIKIYNIN